FLHLSYTFMTDVPFLAVMLAALWCVGLALTPADRAARWGWLAAGSALIGLACLVRQIGIVLVPAVLLGALPEVRSIQLPRWRLLAVLSVPFGAVLAVGALAAGPRDVGVEARTVGVLQASDPAALLGTLLKEVAVSSTLLGLSALPAAALLWTRPGMLRWTRWQSLLAAALLLGLGSAIWYRLSAAPTPDIASLSPLF